MQNSIDSVVDYLFNFADCTYISDMPRLPKFKKRRLARIVETIPVNITTLKSWNDAIHYLTAGEPAESKRETRRTLMTMLAA